MYTIYQAGPLFSESERNWHINFSLTLERAGHTIIWPGNLLTSQEIQAAKGNAISLIFETCKKAIDQCSIVIALLDGTQVDDGTAWEIGYAYAKGIPIYGIRTDFRSAGDTHYNKVNSMIEGCLVSCVHSSSELLDVLSSQKNCK